MLPLKTKRFTIRPFEVGDEVSLQVNINNANIFANTVRLPNPYSIEDAKEWVLYNIDLSNNKEKMDLNLAVIINKEVVGGIGLSNVTEHKAELGYWLAEKYWNQGIMSEAVDIITNYGFKKLKLQRIYATVLTYNTASSKVLEKVGYELEGTLRNYLVKNDKLMDVFMYSIVR